MMVCLPLRPHNQQQKTARCSRSGVDSLRELFSLCSMSVETLGEAWRLGWRVTARCAFGNRDGRNPSASASIVPRVGYEDAGLDTRAKFPALALESRLRQLGAFYRSVARLTRPRRSPPPPRRSAASSPSILACSTWRCGSVALGRSKRCSTRFLDPERMEENDEEWRRL